MTNFLMLALLKPLRKSMLMKNGSLIIIESSSVGMNMTLFLQILLVIGTPFIRLGTRSQLIMEWSQQVLQLGQLEQTRLGVAHELILDRSSLNSKMSSTKTSKDKLNFNINNPTLKKHSSQFLIRLLLQSNKLLLKQQLNLFLHQQAHLQLQQLTIYFIRYDQSFKKEEQEDLLVSKESSKLPISITVEPLLKTNLFKSSMTTDSK